MRSWHFSHPIHVYYNQIINHVHFIRSLQSRFFNLKKIKIKYYKKFSRRSFGLWSIATWLMTHQKVIISYKNIFICFNLIYFSVMILACCFSGIFIGFLSFFAPDENDHKCEYTKKSTKVTFFFQFIVFTVLPILVITILNVLTMFEIRMVN